MLFYTFFQSFVGKDVMVTVELKHGLQISGSLHAVDQYLNLKLVNVTIADPDRHPQLVSLKTCFIRGSVIRYIHLSGIPIDLEALQDSCRKSEKTNAGPNAAASGTSR
eukprot:Blabericola_migrator_1__9217@NODE_4943_length_926_cov_55_386496_g3100_i0_p1_GENE_NODE_4943_length_926_cov_55_386496_g3100_i0NODE_4943_length_926_cov_55_386496_g3100_i0_p1_ORF_typecomplete_len108_score8_90LSM/PF01423_22/6_5e14SMATX/PF14438_6/0_017Hfq/PF17209_3/0_071_NODE_4943_length_926_cov_55_386496_g3100_i0334657